MTLLYAAAKNGFLDVVNFLLENGADVHKGTDSGETPVFIADEMDHPDIVKRLLDQRTFQTGIIARLKGLCCV